MTKLGKQIARRLNTPPIIILVTGEIGAGKTRLIQGIGAGLGVKERIISPSFNIIKEYKSGRLPMYHIDLYRIDREELFSTVGCEDYIDKNDGVIVVEWGERLEKFIPNNWDIKIKIKVLSDTKREVEVIWRKK